MHPSPCGSPSSVRERCASPRAKCCKILIYTRNGANDARINALVYPLMSRLRCRCLWRATDQKEKKKDREKERRKEATFIHRQKMLTVVMRVFSQPIVRNISLLNSRGLNAKNRKLRLIHQVGSFSLANTSFARSLCKTNDWHFVHRIFLLLTAAKPKTNANWGNRQTC